MKHTIIILVLTAGILRLAAQTADIKTFLASNNAAIKPGTADNPLFDASFYKSRFFLFGETHGSALPQQYDLALLKQLHQRAGVRYYIAEVDYTKAWMLNNYLNDGNPQWLGKVFASWKKDTAQWANKEYYNKFISLYQYQQSLPANQKITVVGIDVPQDYSFVEEHITHLTKNKQFNKYQPLMDTLVTITKSGSNKKDLVALSKRLLPVINSDEAFFKKQLDKSYLPFKHLITSFTFISAGMYRDSVMYRNMISQIELFGLQNQKMYGFLGFYHCLQTGYNNSMPFAALFKKYLNTADAIVSIQMYALNSKTMIPYVAQVEQMMPKAYVDKLLQENPSFPKDGRYLPYDLSNDNSMMTVDGIADLKELSQPNSVQLFRLTGTSSPFNQTNKLAQVSGFQSVSLTNKADNTTKAFQYILLFRNSDAATPLD